MNELTLTLKDTDCGSSVGGNTFDVFGVMSPKGEVASVRVGYEKDASVTVKMVHTGDQVFNEVHLLANVFTTITRSFNAETEFYRDLFVNEDGNGVALPLVDVAS